MADNFPTDTSKYKLIVADYDGTLAGPEHIVTPKVAEAVRRWIDSGRHFTIATGRQFNMIVDECKRMDLKTPIIVRGGAEIIDPLTEKTIAQELIDKETIKELSTIFSENNISYLVEKENVLYANFHYELSFSRVLKKELEDFVLQDAPKMAVKAYDHDFEKVSSLMDNVVTKYPNIGILRTHNVLGYGWDITSAKASKLFGITKVLEFLQLKRENVVGVGDSYNDFPLLEAAGLKVAMGNAHPELKEIADVIVPSNIDDGVADLIEKLLK